MDIEKIEKVLWEAYDEMKEQFPELRHLSFELSQRAHKDKIWGFYHIDVKSELYKSLAHLIRIIEEEKATRPNHEILFRQFTL